MYIQLRPRFEPKTPVFDWCKTRYDTSWSVELLQNILQYYVISIRFIFFFAQQTHSPARLRRMKNQDGEAQKTFELVPVNVRSSVKCHRIID